MQTRDSCLIISKNSDNLEDLLRVLSDFEYKPDMDIHLILDEKYNKESILKFIHVLAYFSQLNYSYHTIKIFTTKDIIQEIENNRQLFNIVSMIETHKLTDLLNYDIINLDGSLTNNKGYLFLININKNNIEKFYDIFNTNIRIKLNGNGTI